ncbi:hypothetical protein [Albirhodobacter sp. R86504]|jgi:hypothetical protein|uniref:hypothetical protein n=1 Tax=Albirhodobacter sp. R86504 TaxID=3093848 RepID=UPI00366A868F
MSRHIMDQARPEPNATHAGERLRCYVEIERRSGMHPAIRALHKRPATRGTDPLRLEQFARIERGQLV